MPKIFCVKLQKEAEGFLISPMPGALGERIQAEISQEAWKMWIGQQTMLINEYRLALTDPAAKTLLKDAMKKFLWGE